MTLTLEMEVDCNCIVFAFLGVMSEVAIEGEKFDLQRVWRDKGGAHEK